MLTYSWAFTSKPSASTATLSNLTVANPSFIVDLNGTYLLSLTVNDGTVNSQVDSVTITAATLNSAPTANAGTNQAVATGDIVNLNGGGSDADGDLLTYSWVFTSKPNGSNATLSNTTTSNPTFIADAAGAYIFSLVVNDGKVNSATKSVTVTATDLNFNNTYLLRGNWTFVETIGTTSFTDTYTLDTMNSTPNSSGNYFISGTDKYGNYVNGSYYSASNSWSVYNPGTIIDMFYTFNTDGTNVLPGGCYYQISHPSETWSRCYPLSGIKTNLAASARLASKAVESDTATKEQVEAEKASQGTEYSQHNNDTVNEYLNLKNFMGK